MKRSLNSLMGRLALLQLLIYAVLLPILFFRLDAMVRANVVSTFTQHARAYAGSVAKEFELGDVLESASRTIVGSGRQRRVGRVRVCSRGSKRSPDRDLRRGNARLGTEPWR